MADRLSFDDFDGHAGCRHVLEPQAQDALRTWFTTPVGGSTPLARLRAHLDATVPIPGGWTLRKVRRALRSFIEDEAEG